MCFATLSARALRLHGSARTHTKPKESGVSEAEK